MPEFVDASYAIGFVTGFATGMAAAILLIAGLVAWRLTEG